VTKQFTATAVMMLVEEGKIALDDKIAKHLPGLPAAWADVTVRHLLNHTSGIKSYTSVPGFFKTTRKDYTKDEIIKLVADAPLEFPPGEKWAYNNTGYFLLGMLVETVSGKPYGEFLRERIFQPLGMTATRVNDLTEIIKNRASGYTWEKGALRNGEYVSPTQPYAAGALVSTVADMARWDAALSSGRLLKPETLRLMWTATKLAGGKTQDYGFGWSVGTYRTRPRVSHGGGIPGFSTSVSRFPDDKLTVIVLTNSDTGAADPLAASIAAQYIPALAQNTPPPAKAVEDKDPKVTQMLRGVLLAALEGKLKPDQFTPQAREAIFPDRAEQAQVFLKTLGPLKSLTLRESVVRGPNRLFQYRAVFGETPLLCTLVLTSDNKISGLGIQPE
jgi:CubicO group peptidase (beta-lactamase class C family)